MFTKTVDTDNVVLSFLDISTIAYLKQINKYCYGWIKEKPEISCSNMYPLTKSLFQTTNFIDNNINNIKLNNFEDMEAPEKSSSIDSTLLQFYAKYKYPIDTIKRMVEKVGDVNSVKCKLITHICKYGTYDDIEWFQKKGFVVNSHIISILVKHQRNDVIELLLANDENMATSYAEIEECYKYNNLEALKLLINVGIFKHSVYLDLATEYNNIEIVDLLLENGFPLSQYVLNGIGESGNMILLNRMLSILDLSNIQEDLMVLEKAAERGDKNMISILLDRGFPKKSIVTAHAAAYCAKMNDTRFMEWLLDRGFKKHENAYEYAMVYENMNTLNWLLKNAFPKSTKTFWRAVASSSVKVLNWLLENDFKVEDVDANMIGVWNYSSRHIFDNLMKRQNIDILAWLSSNNIPYDKNNILEWICKLYINKYPNPNIVNIVKCLLENNHPASELVFYFGTCIENYELIDVMIEHQIPYHIKTILHLAKNERYALVKYLLEKNIMYDEETREHLLQINNPEIEKLVSLQY